MKRVQEKYPIVVQFPTPLKGDARSASIFHKGGNLALGGKVRLIEDGSLDIPERFQKKYPTPVKYDSTGGRGEKDNYHGLGYMSQFKWTTPVKADSGAWRPSEKWKGTDLVSQVWKDENIEGDKNKPAVMLNPRWVEWLMGWPLDWTSLETSPDLSSWMNTAESTWWETDPADQPDAEEKNIYRTIGDIKERVRRLECLGNGQVPGALILAWKILFKGEKI